MTCSTCRHYTAVPQTGGGQCYRYPPQIQLVMAPQRQSPANPNGAPMLTAQSFFPPVDPGAHCGEWQAAALNRGMS